MPETLEYECEACHDEVEIEIPDDMDLYRIGTGGASYEMRSDISIDKRISSMCENGHEIGALLISVARNDRSERVQDECTEEHRKNNKSLSDFD